MRIACPKCHEMIDIPVDGPEPDPRKYDAQLIRFIQEVQDRLWAECEGELGSKSHKIASAGES